MAGSRPKYVTVKREREKNQDQLKGARRAFALLAAERPHPAAFLEASQQRTRRATKGISFCPPPPPSYCYIVIPLYDSIHHTIMCMLFFLLPSSVSIIRHGAKSRVQSILLGNEMLLFCTTKCVEWIVSLSLDPYCVYITNRIESL